MTARQTRAARAPASSALSLDRCSPNDPIVVDAGEEFERVRSITKLNEGMPLFSSSLGDTERMVRGKERLELLISALSLPLSLSEVHLCGARLIRNINENCSSERIDRLIVSLRRKATHEIWNLFQPSPSRPQNSSIIWMIVSICVRASRVVANHIHFSLGSVSFR